MKNVISTLLLLIIIQACKPKVDPLINYQKEEISFKIHTQNEEELAVFEDGVIPWISLSNPHLEVDHLIGKDEFVLKCDSALLIIDYPLSKTVKFDIKPANSRGFTRKELVVMIGKIYQNIYQHEEVTAKHKTIPRTERKGLLNRNKTDGVYGIWGHDLEDLDLSRIIIQHLDDGRIGLELIVES